MKKITLFVAALFVVGTISAQTTLTQNSDDIVTGTNSVGCPGGDNDWARNFVLADFGVSGAFDIVSGSVGVQSTDGSGTSITVSVYSSDAAFPASFDPANLLGSQVVSIPDTAAEEAIDYTFDTPVSVPDGTEAVVVAVTTALGNNFFIGGTADETANTWLRSVNCAVPDYTTTTDIGFPDAHPYITVTTGALSVEDNNLEGVSVYPNPVQDVLNVKLPLGADVTSAKVFDILGRDTGLEMANGTINTSALNKGIYMFTLETTEGSYTTRIVKQ